jgi:hypothetical protein
MTRIIRLVLQQMNNWRLTRSLDVYRVSVIIKDAARRSVETEKGITSSPFGENGKLCISLIPLYFWDAEFFGLFLNVRHTKRNSALVQIQNKNYTIFFKINFSVFSDLETTHDSYNNATLKPYKNHICGLNTMSEATKETTRTDWNERNKLFFVHAMMNEARVETS